MAPKKSNKLAPPEPTEPATVRRSGRRASPSPEPEKTPAAGRTGRRTVPKLQVEPPTPAAPDANGQDSDNSNSDNDNEGVPIARRTRARSRSATPQPPDHDHEMEDGPAASGLRRSTRARSTTPQPEPVKPAKIESKTPKKTPAKRGKKTVDEDEGFDGAVDIEIDLPSAKTPKAKTPATTRKRGAKTKVEEEEKPEVEPEPTPEPEPEPPKTNKRVPRSRQPAAVEASDEDLPAEPQTAKKGRSTRGAKAKVVEEGEEEEQKEVPKKAPSRRRRGRKSPTPEPEPESEPEQEHERAGQEEESNLDEDIEEQALANDDADEDLEEDIEEQIRQPFKTGRDDSDSESDSDAAPEDVSTSAAKVAVLSADKQRRQQLADKALVEKQKRVEREEKRKAEKEAAKAAQKATKKEESEEDEEAFEDASAVLKASESFALKPLPSELKDAALELFDSDSEDESKLSKQAKSSNRNHRIFGPEDSDASELESLADAFANDDEEIDLTPQERKNNKGMLDAVDFGPMFDKIVEEDRKREAKQKKKKAKKRKLTDEEKQELRKKRRVEEIAEKGGKIVGWVSSRLGIFCIVDCPNLGQTHSSTAIVPLKNRVDPRGNLPPPANQAATDLLSRHLYGKRIPRVDAVKGFRKHLAVVGVKSGSKGAGAGFGFFAKSGKPSGSGSGSYFGSGFVRK